MKPKYYVLIGFFLVCMVYIISNLGVDLYNTSGLFSGFTIENKLNFITIFFSLIAAIWIGINYYLSRYKEKDNYLKISVDIEFILDQLFIKTSVSNEQYFKKDIDFAFLEIVQFNQKSTDLINKSFNKKFICTNDYIELKNSLNSTKPLYLEENNILGLLYPLYYYTSENVRVGNEVLTYSIPVEKLFENIKINNLDEFYEVKFYVYRQKNKINSYHRVVQTVFRHKN